MKPNFIKMMSKVFQTKVKQYGQIKENLFHIYHLRLNLTTIVMKQTKAKFYIYKKNHLTTIANGTGICG